MTAAELVQHVCVVFKTHLLLFPLSTLHRFCAFVERSDLCKCNRSPFADVHTLAVVLGILFYIFYFLLT